jgi:hypothetical protein
MPTHHHLSRRSPLDHDLNTLHEKDSLIVSIFARFDPVTCCYNEDRGEKRVIEGRVVLYKRWVRISLLIFPVGSPFSNECLGGGNFTGNAIEQGN